MTPMKKDLALPLDVFIGNANGKGLIRIETSIDARPSGVHITSLTRDKKEYAELIVRAVNNHDALLNVCREVEKSLSLNASGASPAFIAEIQHARICLRNAITNAEK